MKDQDQMIREEMRKLIKRSCRSHQGEGNSYRSFQKSLLKFFFGAADVTIDYDNHTISLWTSRVSQPIKERLYDLKELLSVKIAYTSLEETLKGCLEEGKRQSRYYKTLLFHYNHVGDAVNSDAKSA